ncbi:haloacid dehalogenase [Sulfuricaulis limicola]|uniref:Enolase-phosphatase E1 n=1 Tax=Sulfuricaulis limicola TaxID=1620215 RepID=A0A1B4XCH8_9GAMM|nr:acireductone synthase [Sulfuricaulis limicola]BAV32492.1 haloacid dehalogenase [Sulfuricaulis limicola]
MIKAILTDIEGTTSSLSFVKDVLFPYARERMAEFVRAHTAEPAVRKELDEVRRITGENLSDPEVIEQLIRWIDEDRKITPLKSLQGMIWEDGYKKGDFRGHMYEDAARHLKQWQQAGLRLYVFSSGSVQAQKLLFAHTEYGDLTPLFSGYFDTTVGSKREADSYCKIAEAIDTAPGDILFLSDIREELDAARAAGMQVTWLVRDGATDPGATHRQARNFDEIRL